MTVIIGIDPHKATHTAVAISGGEEELDRKKVRAGGAQVAQLVSWAASFPARTWAIESASGLGYLLAQQLVAAGTVVVDGPVEQERPEPRVVGGGRGAAVTGSASCCSGRPSEVLRLLAKRNIDIGNQRTRVVCRMHSLLAELAGGGIATSACCNRTSVAFPGSRTTRASPSDTRPAAPSPDTYRPAGTPLV